MRRGRATGVGRGRDWCAAASVFEVGWRLAAAQGRREKGRLFDEEEEEGIDLRQALVVIYQGDLLPVPATSRE